MSTTFRLSRLIPRFLRGDKGKSSVSHETQSDKPTKDGHICKVLFLDDTEIVLVFKGSQKGNHLLDRVYDHLNLLEKEYFGLRYLDTSEQAHWLDVQKSISSQLKSSIQPFQLYFGVKFYPVDPCKLKEEITRYQFFLQVKRDIQQGRLPLTFEEGVELCSYAIQSELGDYDPSRHGVGYVSEFRFVPNQTAEFEDTIAAIHRKLGGLSAPNAEYKFLDKVKWMDMYGVDLHPVMGEGNQEYFLGLTPMGIVVYRNKTKVGNYFWPRISKVTFKGKIFIIKVRDKNNDEHTYAFEVVTKLGCKHLWKCCVEHHAFFRLRQVNDSRSARSDILYKSTSRRRSSGRHDRQGHSDYERTQPNVNRVPSRRHARRTNSDSRLNAHIDATPYMSGMSITRLDPPTSNKRSRETRSLPDLQRSPKSVRSAPWESNADAGMYTSGRDSPLSMYSDAARFPRRAGHAGSDTDSAYSRKKYFPNKKGSDNESDVSFSRRRRREMDSGSESDYPPSRKGGRRPKSTTEDWYENQWNEAMDCLKYVPNKDSHMNGSVPSLHSAPAGEAIRRRRRRRSKSPGNSKRPPEELKQHFEYDLVDTEGMTEAELRDIPYVKVETKGEPFKVKYSPKTRHRYRSPKRKSMGDLEPMKGGGVMLSAAEEPPPPYRPTVMTPESQRKNYFSDTNSRYRNDANNNISRSSMSKPKPPPPTQPIQDSNSVNSHDTLLSVRSQKSHDTMLSAPSQKSHDTMSSILSHKSRDTTFSAPSQRSYDTLTSVPMDSTLSSEQGFGTNNSSMRQKLDARKPDPRFENTNSKWSANQHHGMWSSQSRSRDVGQSRPGHKDDGQSMPGHRDVGQLRPGHRDDGQSIPGHRDGGQSRPSRRDDGQSVNRPTYRNDNTYNRPDSRPLQYKVTSALQNDSQGHVTPTNIEVPSDEEECSSEETTPRGEEPEEKDNEGPRQVRQAGTSVQRNHAGMNHNSARIVDQSQRSYYGSPVRPDGYSAAPGKDTFSSPATDRYSKPVHEEYSTVTKNSSPVKESFSNYSSNTYSNKQGYSQGYPAPNKDTGNSTNVRDIYSTPVKKTGVSQGYPTSQGTSTSRPLPPPPPPPPQDSVHNVSGGGATRTFGTTDAIKKMYSTPPSNKRVYATQDSIQRMYNYQSPGKQSPAKPTNSVGVSANYGSSALPQQNSRHYPSPHQNRGVSHNVIDTSVIPRTVRDPGHHRDLWTEI